MDKFWSDIEAVFTGLQGDMELPGVANGVSSQEEITSTSLPERQTSPPSPPRTELKLTLS